MLPLAVDLGGFSLGSGLSLWDITCFGGGLALVMLLTLLALRWAKPAQPDPFIVTDSESPTARQS